MYVIIQSQCNTGMQLYAKRAQNMHFSQHLFVIMPKVFKPVKYDIDHADFIDL